MKVGRPRVDAQKRFVAKVKVMESGCHEWQAGLARGGYGKFQLPSKTVTAHRFAFEMVNGSIPKGLCVLHRCDNRLCVNVDHLFLGDIHENIKDMDVKGRRGTRSKLIVADVEKIKDMLSQRFSQQHIAKLFNVNQTTISRIKLGVTKSFKNLE